ncbi:hypothetical protein HNR34_001762 [Geobacillus subterraneus]
MNKVFRLLVEDLEQEKEKAVKQAEKTESHRNREKLA